MLRPEIPAWVEEEIARRWPGVVLSWERFPEQYVIKTLDGHFFAREMRGEEVWHRYVLERDVMAGETGNFEWFKPHPHECLPWRFVVRDPRHKQERKGARVFDCVDSEGAHIPPSQAWIKGLADRYDAWERTVSEMEAEENAAENPDGLILNRKQVEARKQFHDEMTEPALWTAGKLDGIPLIGYGNAPLHGRTGVSTKADRFDALAKPGEAARLTRKAQIVRGG